MVLSVEEAKRNLMDWINAGSVVDPLPANIRTSDAFAFTDLRKTSGKFPKVHVTLLTQDSDVYRFGAPLSYDSEIILAVWFYTTVSKQGQFNTPIGNLKNEQLVEWWLSKELVEAIKNDPFSIQGLHSPRFGEFSGAETDPERRDLYRGFLPISFRRREC